MSLSPLSVFKSGGSFISCGEPGIMIVYRRTPIVFGLSVGYCVDRSWEPFYLARLDIKAVVPKTHSTLHTYPELPR